MKFSPINVTWMITNRCNYNCQFCFRFFTRPELKYDQAVKIIDKLAAAGLRKISWAGGEPLLWHCIVDLIKYTHQKGISTMLITNGELLKPKDIEILAKPLNWLNLPLEGIGDEINEKMTRKTGHFTRVKDIFDQVRELDQTNIRLKINTVASKINYQDIIDLVPFIKKYQVKRWKIFQFYSLRGASLKNPEKFELSLEQFEQLRKNVNQMIDPTECQVVFENHEQMDHSYFALTPDGKVYVSQEGEDIILGDLLTDKVENIWNHPALDKSKYWERSRWVLEE